MTEKTDNRFSGKRSPSFGIFLLISSAVILFVAIGLPILINKTIDSTGLLISSLIVLPTLGLFLWAWIETYYQINEAELKIKCGPFVWMIPVSEIKLIRLNQKTIGGTIKPTLSWSSIEIKYKKHRSIFVTPDRQDDFIGRLKTINDKIEVK
jgi:Protein of unknown function (DUF1200).